MQVNGARRCMPRDSFLSGGWWWWWLYLLGVRCCAVLWWGSRYCMNGLMEWEGIYTVSRYMYNECMLLTAGYSIDIIDLVGMSFLFDYPRRRY